MTNVYFLSKNNFNKITQLVAKTFDMKLNRVQHKLSESAGFKNANAARAALSDSHNPSFLLAKKNNASSPNAIPHDMLYKSDYDCRFKHFGTRDWDLKPEGTGEYYNIESCHLISQICSGHLFVNPEILLFSLDTYNIIPWLTSISETNDQVHHIHIEVCETAYLDGPSIASLQQEIHPDWYISDDTILSMDYFGRSFAAHLLECGNLAQYNYIASNPHLIETHDLYHLVGQRYFDELHKVSLAIAGEHKKLRIYEINCRHRKRLFSKCEFSDYYFGYSLTDIVTPSLDCIVSGYIRTPENYYPEYYLFDRVLNLANKIDLYNMHEYGESQLNGRLHQIEKKYTEHPSVKITSDEEAIIKMATFACDIIGRDPTYYESQHPFRNVFNSYSDKRFKKWLASTIQFGHILPMQRYQNLDWMKLVVNKRELPNELVDDIEFVGEHIYISDNYKPRTIVSIIVRILDNANKKLKPQPSTANDYITPHTVKARAKGFMNLWPKESLSLDYFNNESIGDALTRLSALN